MNLNTIKNYLRKNKIVLLIRLLPELMGELVQLNINLGQSGTYRNKNKMEAEITALCHSVEKGLSVSLPKIGFGENKIINILSILNLYLRRYNDHNFLCKSLGVIHSYIIFNKSNGYFNEQLIKAYNELLSKLHSDIDGSKGGIKTVRKKEILNDSGIDFIKFVNSRYSIRSYSLEEVPLEKIIQALKIAQKSPSSCNRQPWKVYIFKNKILIKRLLEFQEGSKGFSDSVSIAILITSDLNNYFFGENHQAYIDGSLFSMSLIYALHFLGLGSIPLTTGFKKKKRNQLYNIFKIPRNEVPIMIIGVGNLLEEFNVACSERKELSEIFTLIE